MADSMAKWTFELRNLRELRIGRLIFEAGRGCVRIVDQSGACYDETSIWSVCFSSGDQVSRATEMARQMSFSF
jgi:hypothetical protein